MGADADPAAEQPTDDTPDGTVTEQDPQEQINWEERHREAQAWGTRASQKAAELEQRLEQIRDRESDAHREFLRDLGYDIDDDTPNEFEDDPEAARIAALEQRIAAQEQREQEQQAQRKLETAHAIFERTFAQIEQDRGYPLDDEEQDAVWALALNSDPDQNGMPNPKAAYERLEAVLTKRAERQKPPPRRPAHQFSAAGKAGETKHDTTTHEGRVALAMERLADNA